MFAAALVKRLCRATVSVWTVNLRWLTKEGYQALARLSNDRRLKLYRIKPKLHMHDHVVCLDYSLVFGVSDIWPTKSMVLSFDVVFF